MTKHNCQSPTSPPVAMEENPARSSSEMLTPAQGRTCTIKEQSCGGHRSVRTRPRTRRGTRGRPPSCPRRRRGRRGRGTRACCGDCPPPPTPSPTSHKLGIITFYVGSARKNIPIARNNLPSIRNNSRSDRNNPPSPRNNLPSNRNNLPSARTISRLLCS